MTFAVTFLLAKEMVCILSVVLIPQRLFLGFVPPFRIEATLDVENTNQGQELASSISQ